jgi:hypothetical protein
MLDAQLSRPPIPTPWGKCDQVAKTLIPEEVSRAIKERARAARVPESVVIRNALFEQFMGGRAMVEASLLNHYRATTESGTETREGPSA